MLVKTIGTVYAFIQLSPKRLQHFKDMAELLESDTVKFQHHYEVRRLSTGGCLITLNRNYELLMVVLSTEAESGDATGCSSTLAHTRTVLSSISWLIF